MLFKSLNQICVKNDGSWAEYFNALFKPSIIKDQGNLFFELPLDQPERKNLAFIIPIKGRDVDINESGAIAFVYKKTKGDRVFLKHVRVVDPATLSEYRFNYTDGRYIKFLSEITDRLKNVNKDLAELIAPVLASLTHSMSEST